MNLLIVTIVEIHTPIVDVCMTLNDSVVQNVLRTNCFKNPSYYLVVTTLMDLMLENHRDTIIKNIKQSSLDSDEINESGH